MAVASKELVLLGCINEIYPVVEVNKTTKKLLTKVKIEFPKHLLSNTDKLFLFQSSEKEGTILVSKNPILRGVLNLN